MNILNEMQDLTNEWVTNLSQGDTEVRVEMYTEDGAIYSPYSLAAFGRDAHGRQTSIYDLSALDCTNR